jgi:hypothetical protein
VALQRRAKFGCLGTVGSSGVSHQLFWLWNTARHVRLARPAHLGVAPIDPAQGRLLTLRRRVLSDVDHVLDAVIDVPLARFQRGGMRLADHCLREARLTLINHEVSRGPLLAPENLALQHPLSISDSQMNLLASGWRCRLQ